MFGPSPLSALACRGGLFALGDLVTLLVLSTSRLLLAREDPGGGIDLPLRVRIPPSLAVAGGVLSCVVRMNVCEAVITSRVTLLCYGEDLLAEVKALSADIRC